MSEQLKTSPEEASSSHEAQLAAENMQSGQEKTPEIDVESDYEAAKEYSVSDADKSDNS
ncbi:hypothetical protein [Oscillatoria salina]|uniref:hypothetical protein n=1 Tax=Oscillatoria salina TaxID=331517 RepID=UPI0013BDBD03|nr:hypothetical protein [Oscillatoria salina]MBZ8179870.1 hypothetical protein [Oscillatoria salina IIICB1]NET88886.1 hypothetical protein [Kamptonema sp. SIO1D9]